MRIATFQIAPKLGDVEGNIRRADEIMRNAAFRQGNRNGVEGMKLDLLVLPELALTGYNFPSLDAIKPYLEPAGQGPSATWARQTAQRLRCKVCVGYPEIELGGEGDRDGSTEPQEKYYNSLLVVDEQGEVITNYRKTFLYYTDETWAMEGSAELGFHRLKFPTPAPSKDEAEIPSTSREIATSFGICMDINPYRFEAPYTAWEFAHRVLDSKSQLVILSMAWLTLLSREELDALADKPELDTFNYWVQRLMPLIRKKMGHTSNADRDGDGSGGEKKIIIVFANRAGEEDGVPVARYAGTSAIIAVSQRPRGPKVDTGTGSGNGGDSSSDDEDAGDFDVRILCWDMLGATTEGLCFADTTGDPKMVFQMVRAARS